MAETTLRRCRNSASEDSFHSHEAVLEHEPAISSLLEAVRKQTPSVDRRFRTTHGARHVDEPEIRR